MRIFSLLAAVALLPAAGGTLRPLDEAGFQQLVRDHRGKVLLVDFWATWCDPCREELPVLAALDAKLRGKGFSLVTVSADEPESAAQALKLIEARHIPLPAYIKRAASDDNFINAIDPKWSGALPALFLFDREGRKVKSFIGESDAAEIEASIAKLL